jgi:ketosteroid isomerase-like protein
MTASTALVAEELVGLSHGLVHAVQEHDTDKLELLLAEEFTLDGAAGTLSREELLAAAAGAYAIDEFAYHEIDPEVYGNTAVVVSRYSQSARVGDRDATGDLRVTDIWIRRDGRWQIVRRHATTERSSD